MKKFIKALSLLLSLTCLLALGGVAYGEMSIPDVVYVVDSDVDLFSTGFEAFNESDVVETSETLSSEQKNKYNIKFLKTFHVKDVVLQNTERKYVTPLGSAFGIKIYTDGVMVVKTDSVSSSKGLVYPAKRAGIRDGDVILKINDKKVNTNKDVADIFSSSKGEAMRVLVKRDDVEFETTLNAEYCETDGKFRAGIWVRDSSAGIGTLTYFDKENKLFCGLGHAVCDVDTGKMLLLSDGEAVDAVIKGSYKGKAGNPGELCGLFGNFTIGNLILNSKTGVYGQTEEMTSSFGEVPVAMHYEVKEGSAYIISEINEDGPQMFDVNIIKLFGDVDSQEKNMVIEIADEDLINKTGGIVQGMSGSPIIQNGMLVGAVTHVLVNDPTKGYGIFAENMIRTSF